MKQLLAAIVLSVACTGAHASALTLSQPDELAMARKVSSALSDVTSRVTQCVDANKAIEVCRCENKAAIEKLGAVYAEANAAFPQWGDKTLNFPQSKDSAVNTALNFKMLPHAIANACNQ